MLSLKRLPLLFGSAAIALASSFATLAIHPVNAQSAGFGPLQAIISCVDPNANSLPSPGLANVRVVNALAIGHCTASDGSPGVHLMVFYQK